MHPTVSINASLGFRHPLDACLLDLGAAFRHALPWQQNVYLHVEVKRSTQVEMQQQQIAYDQTCTYDCIVGFFTFLHMSCLHGASMAKLASLGAPRSSSILSTVVSSRCYAGHIAISH